MVAAPFVVGALGFVLEALIIRRFYAAPIVAMLGTYALGLIIRESVRGLIGGFYLTVPEPIGGSIDIGAMHISAWRFAIIVITLLVMAGCYLLLSRTSFGLRMRATLENPSLARASGISTPADLRRHVCLRRRARGPCRCADRAGVQPVRRSRRALPDPGLCRGDGRRRRLLHRPGGGRRRDRHAQCRAALGRWRPCVADVLVFVLAIVFIKFRPQGLIAGKGV